jgi:hypothetical protein
MGHQDQGRKNYRSTKTTKTETSDSQHDDFTAYPTIDDGTKTNSIYASVIDIPASTGQVYTDQTGRFPIQSSAGHNYVMVLYDYDSNAILAEPLRNRTAQELLRGYKQLHQELVSKGLRPKLQRLDNEASKILKQFLHDEQVSFQLVPPHVHRRNAAERAIRTFKNHFIAGLCSTDKNFPLYLWDKLLPQATITLNLLRTSRINPRLSAWSQLNGNFDFNRTPMAPPGTKIISHSKPANRTSWAPHGVPGWYIAPALEHYRCYTVYITKTNATRISDTVEFFPTNTMLPSLTSADAAQHAARDLIQALLHPHPGAPFLPFGDDKIKALKQLATIFHTAPPRVDPAVPRVTPSPADQREAPTPAAPQHKATSPAVPKETPSPPPQAPLRANKLSRAPSQKTPDTPLATLFDKPDHLTMNPFANAVIDPITGTSMEY